MLKQFSYAKLAAGQKLCKCVNVTKSQAGSSGAVFSVGERGFFSALFHLHKNKYTAKGKGKGEKSMENPVNGNVQTYGALAELNVVECISMTLIKRTPFEPDLEFTQKTMLSQ